MRASIRPARALDTLIAAGAACRARRNHHRATTVSRTWMRRRVRGRRGDVRQSRWQTGAGRKAEGGMESLSRAGRRGRRRSEPLSEAADGMQVATVPLHYANGELLARSRSRATAASRRSDQPAPPPPAPGGRRRTRLHTKSISASASQTHTRPARWPPDGDGLRRGRAGARSGLGPRPNHRREHELPRHRRGLAAEHRHVALRAAHAGAAAGLRRRRVQHRRRTTDDAVLAVDALRKAPGIDREPCFVLSRNRGRDDGATHRRGSAMSPD